LANIAGYSLKIVVAVKQNQQLPVPKETEQLLRIAFADAHRLHAARFLPRRASSKESIVTSSSY